MKLEYQFIYTLETTMFQEQLLTTAITLQPIHFIKHGQTVETLPSQLPSHRFGLVLGDMNGVCWQSRQIAHGGYLYGELLGYTFDSYLCGCLHVLGVKPNGFKIVNNQLSLYFTQDLLEFVKA